MAIQLFPGCADTDIQTKSSKTFINEWGKQKRIKPSKPRAMNTGNRVSLLKDMCQRRTCIRIRCPGKGYENISLLLFDGITFQIL